MTSRLYSMATTASTVTAASPSSSQTPIVVRAEYVLSKYCSQGELQNVTHLFPVPLKLSFEVS